MTLYPTTRVSRERLRRLFAEHYEGRIEAGLLIEAVIQSYPAPPEAGQVAGTMSEIVEFTDERGRTVAQVHRYVTPEGGIGASGLLDPVTLLIDGRVYKRL